MSYSQASSQYANSMIDPDILQSDDFQDTRSSQITTQSTLSTDLPPPRYPRAPDQLKRVGKPFKTLYILYNNNRTDPMMETQRKQFVEWWLMTEFGSKEELQRSIKWDTIQNKSDVWSSFDQVANARTGEPKVMCNRCQNVVVHPRFNRSGPSPMKNHLKSASCNTPQKTAKQGINQLLRDMPHHANGKSFNQLTFQQKIVKFITTTRLPFRTVEHQEFKELLQYARLSDVELNIPSERTVRRLLDSEVREKQQAMLDKLPSGSRISLALDCWTSPFCQAFMAITGYFLDHDWNYCEVLLGFEHIQGSHTGAHLSETVIRILQAHDITGRLSSITTDNASNNSTMIEAIQEMVQSQALSDTSVFRVPCIVHVIQLSLKDLLGKIKASPENTEIESEWSDERTNSLQSTVEQSSRSIAPALRKVRELAVFINTSPQRRDTFRALQTTEPKLLPIQDVCTRWNSTFLMLERAKKLQRAYNQYCSLHHYVQFQLSQEEWRQIEYLLLITKPFFHYTNVLSKTKDITVHSVLSIYNQLFSHLDDFEEALVRKTDPWKTRMLQALQAARIKLSKYYKATDTESFGRVYAIATILCPSKKLRFFDGDDWTETNEKGEKTQWMPIYRDMLQEEFDRYQQHIIPQQEPVCTHRSKQTEEDVLDLIIDPQSALQDDFDQPLDEITRYLAKGLTKGNTRVFWKDHEHEFPVLAAMARDILAIPASGAGVERLFNCARDICHYRRGQLKPETIRSLVLHLFSSKFDLQQSELEMIKEYLSSGEAAILDQTWKPTPMLLHIDPISDDEEEGCRTEGISDKSGNNSTHNADAGEADDQSTSMQLNTQYQQQRLKRPYSIFESQHHDDHSPPLPEMPIEAGAQGRRGRVRKKPKQPDGFEPAILSP